MSWFARWRERRRVSRTVVLDTSRRTVARFDPPGAVRPVPLLPVAAAEAVEPAEPDEQAEPVVPSVGLVEPVEPVEPAPAPEPEPEPTVLPPVVEDDDWPWASFADEPEPGPERDHGVPPLEVADPTSAGVPVLDAVPSEPVTIPSDEHEAWAAALADLACEPQPEPAPLPADEVAPVPVASSPFAETLPVVPLVPVPPRSLPASDVPAPSYRLVLGFADGEVEVPVEADDVAEVVAIAGGLLARHARRGT